MKHKYELYEQIQNLFEYSWKLDSILNDTICIQFIFENPAAIGLYGQDILEFKFNFGKSSTN